ncbi:MAG: arginine--tRNA ligase [Candidatus Eremiobacteraeota bacterium]|nr:arginine--tRNA ligase [Candidatus Eremiobacteraeota bacterium]
MSRTITKNLSGMLPDDALAALAGAIGEAVASRYPGSAAPDVAFEAPRRTEFGDFSTNVAFGLAKAARRSPADIAADLVAEIGRSAPNVAALFSALDAVGGFINLRCAPVVWQTLVAAILRDGKSFGRSSARAGRVSLEFGSANPTGPLVVVQGRTLSIGDTLAKALRYCGYDVFVEWIVNDYGSQMDTLGRSLYARYVQQFRPAFPFPEEGYPGEYLLPLARAVADRDGDRWLDAVQDRWLPYFAQYGRDSLLAEQQATAARFGVAFDLWQSESELHASGRVEEDLAKLASMGLTYECDGAVFFRTTSFGDDKDRVLRRSDGRPTYLAPDVTYHYEKFQRADRVIDILGPDHHGYIERLNAVAAAMGYPGKLDVLIAQQITLMRGTEQVSMSKRAGNIVTLDDILDEVGIDAARFFFIMLAAESPLTFDLKLATEASNENPVYYVQYGHARIASVLKNASGEDAARARDGNSLQVLEHSAELALVRRLAELPRAVRGVVENLAPHRLAKYARDVASDFHQFYTECKILTEDREVRTARLGLCIATQNVLATVLDLIGVSAPESM